MINDWRIGNVLFWMYSQTSEWVRSSGYFGTLRDQVITQRGSFLWNSISDQVEPYTCHRSVNFWCK